MKKSLPVDQIRTDGDTQNRRSVNDETVADYAEIWKNDPPPFPPIDVFHDGADYWCADGFHRLHSAISANRVIISCKIHKGGARDAFLFGCHANARHGLRRTNADKRFATERLLSDDEWGKLPLNEIAELAGVTRRYVNQCKLLLPLLPPHKGLNSSNPNGGVETDICEPTSIAANVTDDAEPRARWHDNRSEAGSYPRSATVIIYRTAVNDLIRNIKAVEAHPGLELLVKNRGRILIDLNNAKAAIIGCIPHRACPYCRGMDSDCGGCAGRGWVDKMTFENAPKEMRDEIEKLPTGDDR